MEPTTLATATLAALFASEAAKAGGKAFGESTSKLVSQLLAVIRKRFEASKAEGVLAMAEEEPTQENLDMVRTVLLKQIKNDEAFANQLRELLATPEAEEVIRQVGLENIEVAGNLSIGDLIQKVVGGKVVEQTAGRNMKTGGDANFGNISQIRLKP